jgi:two-component system, cell cycle sensor histidine kinase and response regulator CckA
VSGRTSQTISVEPAVNTAGHWAWLDGLADGCLLADRELTILYVNTAFDDSTGRPRLDLIGQPLTDVCGDPTLTAAHRVAVGALASGRWQDTEERDGDRWFRYRAHPVPEGVVVVRSDVSGRQSDEEFLETARDCRLVLEQLPTVHWTVDTDLRFTRSIGAGLAGLGLAQGEATGLTLYEYLQTDDPDNLNIRMHHRALEGLRAEYSDVVYGRHFDITLEPLRDRNGEIAGVIGLANDVTDRQREAVERARLQEQLLLAQKRESLGILAAGVAHDFNNLLSAIVGSAGLLLRELPAGGAPYESAALIKKAAERAAEVTRQMLVYAGKSILSRRSVNVNDLIHDNFALLNAAIPRRVTLEMRLADELPAVLVDSGQIQQVLMNLIMNATEAIAHQEGAVTVTTGIETTEKISRVFVEVADNGCGISPELQLRVFDPFFTTKGRGLGLSAVQGIAHSHGGQIQLASVPGQGTRFRLLLPAGEPVSPRSAGAAG